MTFMIREIQCLIRTLIQYFLQVGTASPYLESRHPSHRSLNLIVTTSVLTKVLSSKFQKGMHAEKMFCLFLRYWNWTCLKQSAFWGFLEQRRRSTLVRILKCERPQLPTSPWLWIGLRHGQSGKQSSNCFAHTHTRFHSRWFTYIKQSALRN